MNSNISICLILSFLSIFISCSCEKELVEKFGMDATIGTDNVWRAESDSINATYTNHEALGQIFYSFNMEATSIDKSTITILIFRKLIIDQTYDAGYYSLHNGPATIYYKQYRPDDPTDEAFSASEDSSSNGQVTITKLDSINKVVSGVFSMHGKRQNGAGVVDYIEIKNGSFNNVQYQ